MADALAKWMGGKLVKPSSALERCREAREAAVSVLQGSQAMRLRPTAQFVAVPARLYPGLLVDLPRKCAVHGGPYAARYVFGDDGRFQLGSMIAATETLYLRPYTGNPNTVPVPGADLGEETCPLCGSFRVGRSAMLCHVCKSEVLLRAHGGGLFPVSPKLRRRWHH